MKRIIVILFFITALGNSVFAQKLTASVSKNRVAVGEAFQLQFSINANGSNFKIPALNDFDVYSGPNQSTSMSYVNGVMSQSITLSFILSAKKEGKLTIAPASIVVNGTLLQSNPIVIDAVKGAASAGSQGSQAPANPSAPTTENVADNLFLKTSVSKTKVFQGEQITITHKVYTRYQLRGYQDIKYPDYTGFWSQDLPINNQQIQLTNEVVNGVTYQVAELRRSYIFPQRSGKLQIEPMTAEFVVRKQSNKRPRDIFEMMTGGGYEDVSYSIKSQPITIDVQPLPEANKPEDFSGAVGEYTYKVQLSKEKVKANDAINLTITLSGKGNIKLVDAPKVNFPEDFETYDPKTKDNISVGGNGVSGSKTFDYVVIPRHEGEYKIDRLSFTFFDPAKNQYITIPSPEFNIHVDKGDPGSSANVFIPNSQSDVKELGKDIRYIRTTDPQLQQKDNYFFGSPLFYAGVISPFLAFIGFIFFRRKNIEQNKDAIAVKSRKATKMAKKRLASAELHLKSGNKELFYLEISQALYGYVSDKLNIAGADLNRENISAILKNKDVAEQTVIQLSATLDNCEYARYAPSAVSGDLNTIYNNTVELITKIENEIR